MLRRTMIALCTVASVALLTPDFALAGHGGGGGGHGGGGGGHAGFGGGGFGARGGSFGGGNFAARGFNGGFSNSFARAAPSGNVAAVQGNRFAQGNFQGNVGRFGRDGFRHGFRHGRHFFFVDGGFYDGYWDYPDYAYDDSYYGDGGCYVVRPVQVCS
jgi:hypothetical protein